eukprot:295867-Pyramimonas_sp.AAC.1
MLAGRAGAAKILTPTVNPKTVSAAELYGVLDPVAKEWRDGLVSSLMRELSKAPGEDPKWLVLDGDVDPEWIESMNR